MLFIQSNSLALELSEGERLRLLDALAPKGWTPLIRSSRRHAFRLLAGGAGEGRDSMAEELERACADGRETSGGDTAYTPGDLFCAGECVFFLVFGRHASGGLSAGVIYGASAPEPLSGLERFCREVRGVVAGLRGAAPEAAFELPAWQPRAGRSPQGLARFIAAQPAEFVRAAAVLRGGEQLARASALMEHGDVRAFLRRVQEMRREGFTPRRLLKEAGALGDVSVESLLEAGLLEKEVRVSCRQSGHALFDLPSPDSLAAVTISRARCSACAAPVADEVIEETLNPSRLAVALLGDGGWLGNRVYQIIRSLGVPETEIASGPPSTHGESCLAVEVCGSSFLFVTRDGDLTPALSRRTAELVEETEAAHVVVVVTGSAEGEGRLRLYEFAWRRARAGQDMSATVVEGLEAARPLIERAFAGAVRRELSRNLFPLDAALGHSAANFVRGWFGSVKARGPRRITPALPAHAAPADSDRRAAS